jgi:uncharacterized protein YjbJ (UPF0337 family)
MKTILKLIPVLLLSLTLAACNQSSERNKSDMEKVTGATQETVGNAVGDEDLESKGKMNKLKGDLRSTKEDVKDVVTGK